MVLSLVHSPNADDASLVGEELAHTAKHSPVQVVAELIETLRMATPPWWSPTFLREQKTATDRMRALTDRPDLRYEITVKLTGYSGKSARKKDSNFQASLIDNALEDGDKTDAEFEDAFPPSVLAVYTDPASWWKLFRERLPWDKNENNDLMEIFLESFLKPRGSGTILSPHDVITSIDRLTWVKSIPSDILAEVNAALLSRPPDSPGAGQDLAAHIITIATTKIIAKHVKSSDLIGVFDAAEKALGFEPPPPEIVAQEPDTSPLASTEPPKEESANDSATQNEEETPIAPAVAPPSPDSFGSMELSPKS